MKLLLDTHAFLWLINDDYAHLRGNKAVELFLANDTQAFLSLASVWEMAIKILQTLQLPFHHRDPFDRLLIAQAIIEEMTLLSADVAFSAYNVKQVW
jgi:PIN domain nuclease of toxin-antitoxin system